METYSEELLKKIHADFKERGLKLSVVESCTAGLISHMLTTLPGASEFFDSAIVAYSTNSKKKLLGVKKSLIKEHGVISEESARSMAELLREKTGADFALSVTGNAGPDAIDDKRVGLVYIAVAHSKGTTSRGFLFDGSRQEIKSLASTAALEFLHETLSIWAKG